MNFLADKEKRTIETPSLRNAYYQDAFRIVRNLEIQNGQSQLDIGRSITSLYTSGVTRELEKHWKYRG
jgi:hypothetical protein